MGLRIFLSAVSGQFKDCRDALASDLRAIGCEVKVQEDFQQGPRTLIERLQEYIAQCDRVIALVGDAYGFEAAGVAVPAVNPPRSYTQWEYFFTLGERLNGPRVPRKDLYLYFASEQFLREHPVEQPAEHAERQRRFREEVLATGEHWAAFDSLDHLCRWVLRDGWQMNERPRKPRNLPYDSIGTLFKGRDAFVRDLHDHLQREPTRAAAIVCKQAIHGLGGVGKTRLAVEYALQYQAEYSALLFVIADTPESLYRNLASICAPLVLNLPEQDAKEQDARVVAALRWLHEHPGWFMILDNVDTPAAAAEVERLLAQLQGGHVLVTSRISDWSRSVEPLELDVLSEDNSVAFLLEKTEGRRRVTPTDVGDARALARELDGLALALEQAGAFISKLRISLGEYLRRWREREVKVRTWYDDRLMKHPRSVAVTWDTTVAQLDPPARTLLQVLSWFAPEPIPRAVLETDAARQVLSSVAELVVRSLGELSHFDPVPVDMEDALAALAGFSLLKWESGNAAFRIHRLVQEVTRERLPADQRDLWLRIALTVVNNYFPGDPPPDDVRSWPRWEPLRAHVASVIAAAEAAGIGAPTTRLMNEFGMLLKAKCMWGEAESLYRRALTIDEQTHGLDHPEITIGLNNLSQLLQATNRPAEAEPLMRRALAIDEQSLGREHPRVAIDLNNLASLLWTTSRLPDAELLMRRALAIEEQSFGPNHPNVARDLNNLTALLRATNRLEEAEPLMRRALAIDEQTFGSDHPHVARDFNNLAQLLVAMNRLGEAEPPMRRALTIDEQSFGPDHPDVARDLNNLAELLKATNRPGEAEPLLRRALRIDEQSFGPEHPSVAIRLNNLARLLQATNRLGEAEPLMRRALIIFKRSLGPYHPNTTRVADNYRPLLEASGLDRAEIGRRLAATRAEATSPTEADKSGLR
jgi:tetratricopeptide (TPR) repeat protein